MQPLQAVRAKDGIFIGNVVSARDASFLSMNKISHVINCCGFEVSNTFQYCGIRYLCFHWRDTPSAGNLFENSASEGRVVRQIREFIDNCLALGECVLIHSVKGINRCCVAAIAYLISKYSWNYENSATYLSLIHSDMSIKPFFSRQLRQLSKRLSTSAANSILLSNLTSNDLPVEGEQLLLRNTYLNTLPYSDPRNAHLRRAVNDAEFNKNIAVATRNKFSHNEAFRGRSYGSRDDNGLDVMNSCDVEPKPTPRKRITFSVVLEQPATPSHSFDIISEELETTTAVTSILKQPVQVSHCQTAYSPHNSSRIFNIIPEDNLRSGRTRSETSALRNPPSATKIVKQVHTIDNRTDNNSSSASDFRIPAQPSKPLMLGRGCRGRDITISPFLMRSDRKGSPLPQGGKAFRSAKAGRGERRGPSPTMKSSTQSGCWLRQQLYRDLAAGESIDDGGGGGGGDGISLCAIGFDVSDTPQQQQQQLTTKKQRSSKLRRAPPTQSAPSFISLLRRAPT